jgi:hypothetical protein
MQEISPAKIILEIDIETAEKLQTLTGAMTGPEVVNMNLFDILDEALKEHHKINGKMPMESKYVISATDGNTGREVRSVHLIRMTRK